MIIKISNLGEGQHQFSQSGKIEELGLTEPFFDGYDLEVKLDKAHHQIVLNSSINLKAHFECDRCSEEFDRSLNANYEMVYMFTEEPEVSGDEELNIIYLLPETDKIDISKDLYDFSILSIPMKKLCKEDCKGLCYKCGTNLNERQCSCNNEEVDPRWQPLLDLKNKLNN